MFPDHFKTPTGPNTTRTNALYGGWDWDLDRMFYANGQRNVSYSSVTVLQSQANFSGDPYRFATVSSEFHFVSSTERQPIFIHEGYHTKDLITQNGDINLSIRAVQDLAVAYMGKWVKEWRAAHPDVPSSSDFITSDPQILPKPPAYTPLVEYPDSVICAPPLVPNIPAWRYDHAASIMVDISISSEAWKVDSKQL
jgi:hypothetical protein